MQVSVKRNEVVEAGLADGTSWAASILLSPVLWGGLLTVGFYQLIPYLPIYRELAERYFCSHPLEYATAALFFVGMATLGLKAIGTLRETEAIDLNLLDGSQSTAAADAMSQVSLLEEKLAPLSPRLAKSNLACRIRDACAYVRGRQSTAGLEEHLKYLAELAAERLIGSYALVRNITWAVPIIGFLGTVIGITIAIANVTPEQLDSSLAEVTGGLAIAFDTTALALTLSLVLVFSSYLVERSEQSILAQVEDLGIRQIATLLPAPTESKSPLAEAEHWAAQQLIEKTETLINWQVEVWQEGVESLRQRWTETLERQQDSFDHAIREGLASTLGDHQQQLGEIRGEFLEAFQTVSKQLSDNHAAASRSQQAAHENFQQQTAELWQQSRTDFTTMREDLATQIDELLQSLSQNVGSWQSQLKESTDAGTEQLKELRRQGDILLKIVAQEEQLVRLQDSLTDNLQAVRAAETFEEALHSLSATVHLLAARTKPQAA